MNNERNFLQAERQYLTSPVEKEKDPMTCEECEGEGTLLNGVGETERCSVCNGEGVMLNDETNMFEAMLSAQEDKADQRREDDFFDNDTGDGMEGH
jgi:DnaJ-class molecular chaperone